MAEALLESPTSYRGGIAPRIAERGTSTARMDLIAWGFVAVTTNCLMRLGTPTLAVPDVRGQPIPAARPFSGTDVEFCEPLPEVTEDFQHRGVMYVQHLPNEATTVKSWRQAFESDNRDEVYKYCVEQYTSAGGLKSDCSRRT